MCPCKLSTSPYSCVPRKTSPLLVTEIFHSRVITWPYFNNKWKNWLSRANWLWDTFDIQWKTMHPIHFIFHVSNRSFSSLLRKKFERILQDSIVCLSALYKKMSGSALLEIHVRISQVRWVLWVLCELLKYIHVFVSETSITIAIFAHWILN